MIKQKREISSFQRFRAPEYWPFKVGGEISTNVQNILPTDVYEPFNLIVPNITEYLHEEFYQTVPVFTLWVHEGFS